MSSGKKGKKGNRGNKGNMGIKGISDFFTSWEINMTLIITNIELR